MKCDGPVLHSKITCQDFSNHGLYLGILYVYADNSMLPAKIKTKVGRVLGMKCDFASKCFETAPKNIKSILQETQSSKVRHTLQCNAFFVDRGVELVIIIGDTRLKSDIVYILLRQINIITY